MTNTEQIELLELIKKAQLEYSNENYIFVIPGFLSKKFIAFCSMKEDLTLVINYIDILKLEQNQILKSSLTYSMIALYGKCFTDASKNKTPKLDPNYEFKNNEKMREIHDSLMELRHNFIAHRGKTDSEIGLAMMLVSKSKALKFEINFKQSKQISFDEEKLLKIKNLVEYLISELEIKIQKSGQKIYNDMFSIYKVSEMKFMSINI